MVFAGLYPVESHQYAELREALEKLRLNDASFFFEPETSAALGFGFRCGFLGPAPHGDRAGAARARVQHGPGHDRAGRAVPRDDDRRAGARDRQPVEAARSERREDRRAGHYRDDADAVGARRRDPEALPGQARRAEVARVREREPGARHLRAAVQRGGARLLRQAEDAVPRLRVARLSCDRLLGVAAREDGHPRQRRSGRRAVDHRAPRRRRTSAGGRWRPRCAS